MSIALVTITFVRVFLVLGTSLPEKKTEVNNRNASLEKRSSDPIGRLPPVARTKHLNTLSLTHLF